MTAADERLAKITTYFERIILTEDWYRDSTKKLNSLNWTTAYKEQLQDQQFAKAQKIILNKGK